MGELELPTTRAEVDARWLTAALREGGGLARGEVTAVELGAPEGGGNAGGALRARLAYRGAPQDAPATLVLKLPPDEPVRRQAMRASGLVSTEVGFYRDLAGRVPLRTPRVYFAADDGLGNAALLLEDLGDVPGSWPGRPLSAQQATMMLEQLAELHAAYWNDPSLEQLPWLSTPASRAPYWRSALQEIRELLAAVGGAEVPAEVTALLEVAPPRMDALTAHLSGPPFTLVHGDFTQRNVALVNGEPVAFDWQLCQRMRGARDVAYLMPFLNLQGDPGVAPRALVDGYHAALLARGVTGYSREELARDQDLASFEVMQIGLATMWAPLAAAAATGGTLADWQRGMLASIAAGVRRLGLIERLERDFAP